MVPSYRSQFLHNAKQHCCDRKAVELYDQVAVAGTGSGMEAPSLAAYRAENRAASDGRGWAASGMRRESRVIQRPNAKSNVLPEFDLDRVAQRSCVV